MTDREIVLQRWPDARTWKPLGGDGLICICREAEVIGEAYTEEAAWRDARVNMEKQHG